MEYSLHNFTCLRQPSEPATRDRRADSSLLQRFRECPVWCYRAFRSPELALDTGGPGQIGGPCRHHTARYGRLAGALRADARCPGCDDRHGAQRHHRPRRRGADRCWRRGMAPSPGWPAAGISTGWRLTLGDAPSVPGAIACAIVEEALDRGSCGLTAEPLMALTPRTDPKPKAQCHKTINNICYVSFRSDFDR